jgi:acyl carrier protein
MEQIIADLKVQIVKALNLQDIEPSSINENDPLFGEGLGLDSIDALELIVLLEKEYGLRIENPADAKKIFTSIKTMAEFISANRK